MAFKAIWSGEVTSIQQTKLFELKLQSNRHGMGAVSLEALFKHLPGNRQNIFQDDRTKRATDPTSWQPLVHFLTHPGDKNHKAFLLLPKK